MANNKKNTGGISVADFMAGQNPGGNNQQNNVGGKSYSPDADSLTGEKQTRATAADKFFGIFGIKMPDMTEAQREAVLAKEDEDAAYRRYSDIYKRNSGGFLGWLSSKPLIGTPNTREISNAVTQKVTGEDWKQQEYDAYLEYLQAQQRRISAEEKRWAEVEQSADFAQAVDKGKNAYEQWVNEQSNKNIGQKFLQHAGEMGARIVNMDPYYNRPDPRWNEQELNRFFSYFGDDQSRAWEYAAQVNDKYNAMQVEGEKQQVRSFMKWDENNWANWGKTNLGFLAGVLNDPSNSYDYLTTLGQTAIMGEPHRGRHMTSADLLNTMSESQANQMQEDLHFDESIPFIGGKGAGDAFQLAQSIAKAGLYAYLGQGLGDYPVIGNPTTLLMGGGAANQTYQNAKARGATEWQALALGGIEGLVESVTEKYSIENLLSNPKNLAKFVVMQAFTEGSEEISATVLDTFADNLVMRDKSEFNQNVYAYMANGLSPEEAKKRAYIDWAVGAIWDFIGGALSGGISGTGRIGLSSALNYEGDSQYLLDLANQTPEDSAAKKYAEKFQETFDRRGSLSSLQASRLQEYSIEALNETDKPALVNAAAEQLKRSGLSDATARARADVIVDAAFQELFGQETKSFKNEVEQRVYRELVDQLEGKKITGESWVDTKSLARTKAKTTAAEKAETRLNVKARSVETKSGEKGEVTRAVMTDDGLKLEVKTESGTKEYGMSDLKLREGQNLSLSVLSQILGKDAAAAYNGMSYGQIDFDNPLVVISYANAWASVRDQLAGKSEAEMLKSDLRKGLSDIQAIQAWKAGQNRTAVQVETRKKSKKGEGRIGLNGAVLPDGSGGTIKLQGIANQRNFENHKRYKVLKALCEAMHIDCVLFDSSRNNGKGAAMNGAYIDGVIYLDWAAMKEKGGRLFSSTDVMFRAMSHELTHFIQQQAPQEYAELKSFVTGYLSEKMGKDYNDLVTEKMWREYDSDTGYVLSRSAAEDEVVADACETMLRDSEYVQKMFEENRSLFDTISGWVHKFLRQIETADIGAKELQPVIKQVRDLWDAGLRAAVEGRDDADETEKKPAQLSARSEAIDRLSDGGQKIVESLGENAEIQVDKNGDMEIAESKDKKTVAFSMKTYDEGGKDKLIQALKENGHTQEEIDAVIESIEATGDFLEKLAQQYSDSHGYENLKRNLWAGITTNLKTGKQVLSALVNNGDYPVNIDLQLICKKRVAYMRMLTRLIDDGIFESVEFKGAAIADLNAILRDAGFETACLGCFVESRRLQLQAWAETIVEEWNDEVDKRNKNAGGFNFAKGGNKLTADEILNLSMELENAGKKNDKGNLNLGKGGVKVKMGRLLDKVPSLAQHLTVADLLTPEGLRTLRAYDQNLFSLVKQRYGAASPKIVQDFNPYNSEIADLSFQFVKKMIGESVTGSKKYTDQAKKELPRKKGESTAEYNRRVETLAVRKYLYDIGGARIQSFSDFMIENVFDYMQIVADLSARELPLHGYSKEAIFLRLFGMTGGKFNGSLIAHVESSMGKEYAGLLPVEEASNGRGLVVEVDGKKYAICFDDYARHAATGSFIQSIGLKDIVALQLDPRYSKNVGSITIGVSDKQILAMLDSPYFRMVIPYHASGMIPEFAKLVGVSNYNDYTDYQTTRVNKCFDLKGNPVEGFWNADGEKVNIDTHFNFNESVQRLGDARAAANEYLEWCKQRHPVYDGKKLVGYATYQAKFSDSPYGTDFTQHENYYKLLEDFNVYDSLGEASALQGAVTMTLPSEANRLTPEQMDAYKQALRDTGLYTEKEIAKYAKKADMTFQELIAEEVGNRAEYESRQAKVWDETVDKAEQMLLEKYGRVQASTEQEMQESVQEDLGHEGQPVTGRLQLSRRVSPNSTTTLPNGDVVNTLKYLNDQIKNGEVIRTYKTFLEVRDENGRVYLFPPMASMQRDENGKLKMANAMAVGEWEESIGNPNSKNIIKKVNDNGEVSWLYRLVKDNGDTVDAAYDPYQHSSDVVLNDQFEQAYLRPNLVTYECLIPKSELTSGYWYKQARADGDIVEAALPVGQHEWKKGTVASSLTNTNRSVYLTRWLMPTRRLSDAEVAKQYKEILDREDAEVKIPFNVVPPGLLKELENAGVPIEYAGSPGYQYHDTMASLKTILKGRTEYAKIQEKIAKAELAVEKAKTPKSKASAEAKLDAARGELKALMRVETGNDILEDFDMVSRRIDKIPDKDLLKAAEEYDLMDGVEVGTDKKGKPKLNKASRAELESRLKDVLAEGKTPLQIDLNGSKKAAQAGGRAQFSTRGVDKYYVKRIEAWDEQDHGGSFRVGTVSEPLLSIGIPDVDIWLDESKAATQIRDKEEITKEELKQIPNVLEDPVVIAESYDKTVLVFGELHDKYGHPIMIALRVDSTKRRNNVTIVNKIRSIGTREANLDKILQDENILFLGKDKKRTKTWFNALGRSTPFGGTKFGPIRMISFSIDGVNPKPDVFFGIRNDEKYMDAVKRGDMNTAQRLVDEFAKAIMPRSRRTGEENTIYINDGHRHGRKVDFVNAILDGVKKGETRSHKSLQRGWVGIAKDGIVYGRVKLGDPIVLKKGTKEYRDSLIKDTEFDIKDGETKYYYPILEVMDLRDNPRPITRNGNYGQYQFKSNEPVTYDDDGNVIPLSKRFDLENPDIRFSVRSDAKTDRELLKDARKELRSKQRELTAMEKQQEAALDKFQKAVDRYETKEREVTQALRELDRLVKAGDNPAAIQQARANVNAKEAQMASAVDNLTKSVNASEIQQILQQERRIERQRTRDKMEESSGRRQALGRVKAKAGELYEMLTTNSDKVHVPEILKAPLAEFLEGISIPVKETYKDRKTGEVKETRSHQNFAARLLQLTKIVENQQKYIAGDPSIKEDLGSYLDISDESLQFLEDCSEMITQAMAEAGSFTIDQMNAEQLRDLAKFLSNLKTAIRNMNNFMANERFASVRDAASADIIELDKMRASQNKADAKYPGGVLWKNGTPYYIFKRFGEGGRSIFKGFTKGWGQMAFDAREIIEYTRQTYTDKEVKAWKKQIHSITLEDGRKITMTTGQIMELAMLLGRQQAVNHINAGGIRIGDINGRSDTTHYHLTDADVREVLGKLNERQMDVAKKLQRFMADKGAEWGNEISMKRFGYRFYDEGPGYYPIRTDANDRPMADTDIQKNSMFRLLNLSSSKKINPKASNALVVGDIFDTFADHMADMAKLHGMGLPILDAIKWFNFKERVDRDDGTYDTRTIQGSLERALGKSAGQYFRTLMKDINGQTENGDRGTGLLSFFTSKFKAAAVGGNLRVALLQPTAYVRASTVIKPIYLAAAMGNLRGSIFAAGTAKAAWREAMKYSGEMVWKDIGGYNTDLARSMRSQIQHDDGWMDKITEASMLGAEWGDKLTWGRIWMACKLQAQAENRGIGHEELMKKTEELFNEVIYSSQVMDSTLTRSELMRSRSQADKLLTAFMAEPTVSFNILMDSASDYHLASKKYGRQVAWARTRAKLGKAFAVYLSSAAAAALVESLADAMRDDDDEEYWKKFLEALLGEATAKKIWGEEPGKNDKGLMSGNLMQDLSILGKLPVLKDVINIASGYKASNMSLDAFTNLLNVYKIWIETIELNNGALDKATSTTYYGKMTTWGKIYKSLQALSQLSGLPASNVTRDATAIWNTVMNGWKDEWKIRTYDKDQLSQSKVNDYKTIVAPTGLSLKRFQTMYREMDEDGNGSIKQDEAGTYLREKIKSGELTKKQASAVWAASVNGKTSFEQWLEKSK